MLARKIKVGSTTTSKKEGKKKEGVALHLRKARPGEPATPQAWERRWLCRSNTSVIPQQHQLCGRKTLSFIFHVELFIRTKQKSCIFSGVKMCFFIMLFGIVSRHHHRSVHPGFKDLAKASTPTVTRCVRFQGMELRPSSTTNPASSRHPYYALLTSIAFMS